MLKNIKSVLNILSKQTNELINKKIPIYNYEKYLNNIINGLICRREKLKYDKCIIIIIII